MDKVCYNFLIFIKKNKGQETDHLLPSRHLSLTAGGTAAITFIYIKYENQRRKPEDL